MSGSQKIRGLLYYASVAVFIIGLPVILTYTMGYQFDTRAMKFTRTGIISVKTEPPGASVYLDGRLLPEKTPASIAELLPGTYHLRLTIESLCQQRGSFARQSHAHGKGDPFPFTAGRKKT